MAYENKIFNGFVEAFNYVAFPTKYETEHNIKIKSNTTLLDLGDIKVTERITTDDRSMLILFFKSSTQYDTWMFWVPSANQMDFLEKLCPEVVKYFNNKNVVKLT